MTTPDPETGKCFDWDEMVDQVAIFFLAGHETSASALAWALYLLAAHPEWQDLIYYESQMLSDDFYPCHSYAKPVRCFVKPSDFTRRCR